MVRTLHPLPTQIRRITLCVPVCHNLLPPCFARRSFQACEPTVRGDPCSSYFRYPRRCHAVRQPRKSTLTLRIIGVIRRG
ncbi:hypothetical protein HMPREF3193_02301 [Bifidobacterium breve]|nr:hypothetical protein HMPREF1587_01447 [Bifidobacterium breve JCP7499]KWZ83245.1 hypothetical protein HMPREF3193_02301 [Bifidobacterium breve]